jgi:ABC-type antimicrobial peptide transport system permease subunit
MEGPTCQIVGVVGDVNQAGLDVESFSEIYVKGSQNGMVVMVRAAGEPAGLIPAIRRELASLDPNVPIVSIQQLQMRMEATLERRRFSTLLFGIFAGLAVILTAVGIYGSLNYWVATRKKEIAIRMALGARRSEILWWTGWHVSRIAAAGIALGTIGCLGASRLLGSMVFGISASNPLTLLAACLAVIALASLAACVPIWRATRVDAIHHLRDA